MTDENETETAARQWVADYEKAWASNDPDDIRALFTADAEYRTAPWRPPWRGSEAIVSGWLDRRDEPGSFEFRVEAVQVMGGRAVVEGVTVYPTDGPDTATYSNLWILDLDPDGRARAFTEWWMNQASES